MVKNVIHDQDGYRRETGTSIVAVLPLGPGWVAVYDYGARLDGVGRDRGVEPVAALLTVRCDGCDRTRTVAGVIDADGELVPASDSELFMAVVRQEDWERTEYAAKGRHPAGSQL